MQTLIHLFNAMFRVHAMLNQIKNQRLHPDVNEA